VVICDNPVIFNELMLPVFPHTRTEEWIDTWDLVEALNPKIVIPSHGHPTDLATVTKWIIWVFAILVALSQLGIASGFVQTIFTGLVYRCEVCTVS